MNEVCVVRLGAVNLEADDKTRAKHSFPFYPTNMNNKSYKETKDLMLLMQSLKSPNFHDDGNICSRGHPVHICYDECQ